MRVILQIVWFVVIFLTLLGLATLAMTAFLPNPMSPEQFGYAVGRYALWLLALAAVIVWLCSARGWLPGVQKRRPAA